MSLKKIIAILVGIGFAGIAAVSVFVIVLTSDLPQIITVQDYSPLLVSEVYDRGGKKIGEFYREKRILVPFEDIPPHLVQAFISAEDSSFFKHDGLNFVAIFRAMIANIKAGRKVQGGSTITMQVARSLILQNTKKTYTRKIREAVLARRMEDHLSKEDIIYLYLNQIYLGQGAYGVGAAAEIYFRKPVKDLTIAEAALLAGLPQAPSRYSPIYNPSSAKARQKYVLSRMAEEGYITEADADVYKNSPLQVYVRKNYEEEAPYYVETVRQILVDKLGEKQVLDNGIKVYTGLDIGKQREAQHQVQAKLRELDKRQGFRGPEKNLSEPEAVAEFLLETRNELMQELSPLRVIQPDGSIDDLGPLNLTGKDENGETIPPLPEYVNIDQIVKGIVTNVDDKWGLVSVRFAEGKGLIDIESMEWARVPDPKKSSQWDKISKPSTALKKGDIILVRPVAKTFRSARLDKELRELKTKLKKEYKRPEELPDFDMFTELYLEQEPTAQGSLISFDQNTEEIIAMVGGYDFEKSEFNRALQAARQTGSSFKPIVYAAAMDKNYTPATPILDAPIVFEEELPPEEGQEGLEGDEVQTKKWKPTNHGKKFSGEVLFRNALIDSMNIPTVKVIQDIGVDWVEKYSRRLEIFSPLNRDFTLALGSSGVTLYEMTKVFSIFGRLGKDIDPIIIHKVEDAEGQTIQQTITLDERFEKELSPFHEEFEKKRLAILEGQTAEAAAAAETAGNQEESTSDGDAAKPKVRKEPNLYFEDPKQLLSPQTSYLTISLLQGVVEEGTGRAARALGRPTAGKTGTTNGYYDAWFVGFTADIATGVWVGFDEEKTLGVGEVGGRAALPIWVDYMKFAHEGLPVKNFKTPEGIVFANIDNSSGKLASANSEDVVRQAFVEGTEPQEISDQPGSSDEDKDFYKEDLSE